VGSSSDDVDSMKKFALSSAKSPEGGFSLSNQAAYSS